jgi:hypothetical protein
MPANIDSFDYALEDAPESWSNVREFAKWYVTAGLPILFPNGNEVFCSDDATATCLFRKGQFQVELYMIHPRPKVPEHSHPYMEVIEMRIDSVKKLAVLNEVLLSDETHGPGIRLEAELHGFPLIAFQHWLDRKPTTIASMWRGITAGPKHLELIRRFNPNAYIDGDYADITKPANYRELLSKGLA